MVIDSSGNVGIGKSPDAALDVASSGGYILNERFPGADSAAPGFAFRKSRGSSAGSFTIVANGDSVGDVYFSAADGNSWHNTAHIGAVVDDGSPADGAIGGKLKFRTSNTSGTMTEALSIDSSQDATFAGKITQSMDSSGGVVNTFRNENAGSGAYCELHITNSDQSLVCL